MRLIVTTLVLLFSSMLGAQTPAFTPYQAITRNATGNPNIHNPNCTYGVMTDQEGNVYKTIVIGTQEWKAENLNTSIYRNGDAILTNLDNAIWQNTASGAWAYNSNDSSYAFPYGKLYNWHACVDARQLCPVGWHVPTDEEWSLLINFLDPTAEGGIKQSNVAGGMMKTIGTIEALTGLWTSPNAEALNSSGFSGLPGGSRDFYGRFNEIGNFSVWWSSTGSSDYVYFRALEYGSGGAITKVNFVKQDGFSVRCLRG